MTHISRTSLALMAVAALMGGGGTGARAATPVVLGLYAANFSGASVTEYSVHASGNAAPLRRIAGPHTGIGNIRDVKVDQAGNIYTVNLSGPNFINVFAPTANGDVTPIRQISGLATQLSDPLALAVDAQGYLYVANQTQGGPPMASILVFGPDARGDAEPIRQITGAGEAVSLAIDGAGELVVGVTTGFGQTAPGRILIYAPGANGNATPVRRIAGPETALGTPYSVGSLPVAVLPGGRRVRAAASAGVEPRINVYANGANGDVAPQYSIVGPATGLRHADALVVDASGRSFVADAGASTIATFASDAAGNTAPVRTIAGPATGLSYPIGLGVGPR